jgi:hypothetical protein
MCARELVVAAQEKTRGFVIGCDMRVRSLFTTVCESERKINNKAVTKELFSQASERKRFPTTIHYHHARHHIKSCTAGRTGVFGLAQYSTAQHSTAQHSTAQHSTAQHSTAQHSTPRGRGGVRSMQLPSSWFLVAVNDKVNKSGACDDGPEHQPDGQVRRIEPARTADTK